MDNRTLEFDLENPPFPLTAIDRQVLATKDEDYHRTTWAELKQIIAKNSLGDLKRTPSDLRRYLAWSYATKQQYGSITNFVVQERLHWTARDSSQAVTAHSFAHKCPVPFVERSDYAVLRNDWPYGFAPGITHLLVWSKTPITVNEDGEGDVTSESRRLIEAFVERYFVHDLEVSGVEQARQRVLWLKNWVGLQSVRGIDHVHVLVRNVSKDLLDRWTQRRDLQHC